jgi:tetratricopeptide (TPR) repeat protein
VVALGHAMEALFTERPSLPKFDVALELALQSDPTLAVTVLALRSVSRIASDDAPGAIADATAASERATSFGGPVLAGALSLESQARLAGGEHELARARLESSAALAASCDATTSWAHDSLFGDIAFERGDLSEALRSYARSLQGAEARGDAQQIAYDLIALAGTLARLHLDESAAEVVGILDAHCMGVGATREQMLPVAVGRDEAMAALDRLGRAAEAPRQRGVAVVGGQRIARAVMLATPRWTARR